MLDTNVADALLLDARQVRAMARSWDILVTHVQIEEVLDTPDKARRTRLILTLLSLGARLVPSAILVFDVSRLDYARLGTEDLNARFSAYVAGNPRHAQDGIIAATAFDEGAVLVTAERARGRLAKHFPELVVWSPAEFRAYADKVSGIDPSLTPLPPRE